MMSSFSIDSVAARTRRRIDVARNESQAGVCDDRDGLSRLPFFRVARPARRRAG
jgi:hypothetical protein